MIRLHAGCKLNLGLRVGKRGPDGYHAISSVFLPIAQPADEIQIGDSSLPGIQISCIPEIVTPEKNIVVKAYNLFASITGYATQISIRLTKRIPTGAGLGGGSSDAAALLLWLNSVVPAPLHSLALAEIAAQTGADVPFFLINLPAYVYGKGEKSIPIRILPKNFAIVAVWPEIHVNTAWAFAAYDELISSYDGRTLTNLNCEDKNFVSCECAREFDVLESQIRNDLELPVFAKYPQLAALKRNIIALGASRASMSGSGSTIFGIFKDMDVAACAVKKLRGSYSHVWLLTAHNTGM